MALFQAYLQADDMFGVPLRARIGRQELSFGSEFLVGKGDKAPLFRGLSFDAVRLTYGKDSYTIDAWWAKLAERSPIEEDGDVDFYGLYGSCKAIEDWTFDAYWLYLRDARSIPDTAVNDFSVTNLHTVGLRAAGKYDAFDLEAEVAYQFGNVDQLGSTFTRGALAADDAKADVWGGRIEGGYTFDVASKPRLFAGLMYFGGEDNRGYCPYKDGGKRPKASVSFNRLFSNQIYSGFVDLNDDFSNGYVARIGVNAMPVDKLGVMLCVSYFGSIEEFVTPLIPQNCKNPKRNDGYLGTEAYLALFYQYSQDLMFEAGWAHWFGGDGSAQGQFTAWNGTMFNGGSSDADGDYIYLGSKLKF